MLIAVNVVVKPLYTLLIEPLVQQRIGMTEYGRYAAVLNITLIATVLLDLGITGWNTVHTAKSRGVSSLMYWKLFKIRGALALLYLIVICATVFALGYESKDFIIAIILGLTQVCSSFVLFLRSYTSGTLSFRDDRLLSVLDKVILFLSMGIIFFGPAVFSEAFNVYVFCGAQFLTSLLVMIVAILCVRKYKSLEVHDFSYGKVLRSAFPYALLFLMNIMMLRMDTIIIDALRGPDEAGRYMMSYRFFEAIIMIAYLLSNLLLPAFARYHQDSQTVSRIFNSGFRSATCFFLIVVCVLTLMRKEILMEIYGDMGAEQMNVFSLMILSSLCFALQYVTGSLLTSLERIKVLILISMTGLILNLTLNYGLIPKFGYAGSAFSCLITQLCVLLSQFYFVSLYLGDKKTVSTGIISMALALWVMGLTYLALSLQLTQLQNAIFTFALLVLSGAVMYKWKMIDFLFVRVSISNNSEKNKNGK